MARTDSTVDRPLSDQLEAWFRGSGPRTVGGLIDMSGEKSFAVVFIVLMAAPALPLPTGGVTHVLEVVTMLVALQLIAGRKSIWLPESWKKLEVGGKSGQRFATKLVQQLRRLERVSRPRLRGLFRHRLSTTVFGILVLALSLTAFVAPPFSGLDTLPALGVVLLALGVLLEDALIALIGAAIGAIGAILVVFLGSLVVDWIGQLV